MTRAIRCLAALVILAACGDSTAPGAAHHWHLSANASDGVAGYCIVAGDFELTGTPAEFSGSGEIQVTRSATGFHMMSATAERQGDRVEVGSFVLTVDRTLPGLISGTWTCDGGSGPWALVMESGSR